MNIWQFAIVIATILVVGYLGFGAFIKSIQALGPKIEASILKRGEERIVILKNQGISVRNSTGYIWEETIELEPGCTLISLVEEVARYYSARGNLNVPRTHANWLWLELVRTTDQLGQHERVLVARMAEFPGSAPQHLRVAQVESRVSGNGDHDHEPVLAGSAAGSAEPGDSTC